MSRIALDLARLHKAGGTLGTVKRELEGASASSRGLAEAVGHDSLADALLDFASKWDDTREDMVADIGTLGEVATGIADAFGQLDSDYASALEGA